MKNLTTALVVFTLILGFNEIYAQGTLSGTITDNTNLTINNATVKVSLSDEGTQANNKGAYSLKLKAGTYEVEYNAVGFSKKIVSDIVIIDGTTTTMDVVLDRKKGKINEIIVRTTMKKESISAIINVQKNSATIMDAVSGEAIKQMAVRNTADVLKRVSGTTIIDNRYVIIRGLSDRYNSVYLNNGTLPSTDADRKVFSFDIIPSSVIENIQIVKAATPNMPADFAGGLIFINTREASKSRSLNVSLGGGFNTQATFQSKISSPNGKSDWLGIDDGTRSLPRNVPTNLAAFNTLTELETVDLTKKFNNNFGNNALGNVAPNSRMSVAFSKGWEFKKDQIFSATIATNYSRNFRKEFTLRKDLDIDNTIAFDFKDTLMKDNVLAGGLANFGFQINKSHKILFKNLFNQNTDRTDINRYGEVPTNDYQLRTFGNSFSSNTLRSHQLSSLHKFGKDIKLNIMGGLSTINRDMPDFRNISYNRSLSDSATSKYRAAINQFPNIISAGRFYSKLAEINYSAKVDLTVPIKIMKKATEISVGAFLQNRKRQFDARRFGYVVNSQLSNLLMQMPDSIFAPSNIGKDGLRIQEATTPTDKYDATSSTKGVYLMDDITIFEKLKLVYGARLELFDMTLNSNDGNVDQTYTRNYDNLLPSIVATYLLNKKTNIRASYSTTISRPEFREIAPFSFYDFLTNSVLIGNDKLQQSVINNVDLRYEFFPDKGELLSASLFYKYFDSPIEQSMFNAGIQTRSFINSDFAILYGAETEFRKSLGFINKSEKSVWKDLAVFGNLAYIKSEVEYVVNTIKYVRPMQYQSNYIINTGASYVNETNKISGFISYNRIGGRIVTVGDNTEPSVWEKPRDLLDFSISKKIKDNFEIRLTANDILNQNLITYQNTNETRKFTSKSNVFTNTKFGSTYGITFSYNLK
jgi:outer membrane receptor protein involved in Fe transport